MSLSKQAKEKINHLYTMTAQAYGGTPGEMYVATPAVAQTLNDKIVQDGNWFLQLINTVPVSEMTGEKVILGVTGNIASRTDTSALAERVPKNMVDLTADPYILRQTNSDVALRYSTIDAWAKFPDFHARYNRAVRLAIGNDRIKVGFNGTSAAATTTALNLSDVNIGWLEQIRTYNAGAQYLLGTGVAPVQLGSASFKNLDRLVHDALDMVEIQYRDEADLVVLLGRNVVQYAKGMYFDAYGNRPTEKQQIQKGQVIDTYGGLPAYVVPFLDPDTVLVTSFDNLSVYWQDSSWRRRQIDYPRKDQFEDFNSRNEGYVVEHLGECALIQGITYV